MDVPTNPEAADLRRRAKWYREMAEIGQSDMRDWRIKLAQRLERLADGADCPPK